MISLKIKLYGKIPEPLDNRVNKTTRVTNILTENTNQIHFLAGKILTHQNTHSENQWKTNLKKTRVDRLVTNSVNNFCYLTVIFCYYFIPRVSIYTYYCNNV